MLDALSLPYIYSLSRLCPLNLKFVYCMVLIKYYNFLKIKYYKSKYVLNIKLLKILIEWLFFFFFD